MSPSHTSRPGFMYFAGRAIIRPFLQLRYRPRITGTEHLPRTGPVLLVSNHLAALDTVLIPSFAPRQVRFLAKESLFRTRIQAWVMRGIGAVPVHRAAGSEAQSALETGKRILLAGHVFAIFPEGTRSRSGRLQRGKTGAAWLAFETGATVIPVGVRGTGSSRDATGVKIRVEMRIGAPVPLGDLQSLPAGRARREATERIMEAIARLSGQERDG